MIGGEENESVFIDGWGGGGGGSEGWMMTRREMIHSDGRCMTDVFFFYRNYLE